MLVLVLSFDNNPNYCDSNILSKKLFLIHFLYLPDKLASVHHYRQYFRPACFSHQSIYPNIKSNSIVFILIKLLKNVICVEEKSFYFYHDLNLSIRPFIGWTYIEAYLFQLVARILVNHTLGSLSKSVYRLVFPPLLQITRHVVLSTLMNIHVSMDTLLHHYIIHCTLMQTFTTLTYS